jgi:hypothetical protein
MDLHKNIGASRRCNLESNSSPVDRISTKASSEKDQTATASLSTESTMQKHSLKEDVSQSRREALKLVLTPSEFAIKFPDEEMPDHSDELAYVGDETKEKRIAGRKTLKKSLEAVSTDNLKLKGVDKTLLQEKERVTGPETLKLKEASSDFASEFPDEEMPNSDFLLKKKAAIPEEFEEENPPQHDDADLPLKKAAAGAVDGSDIVPSAALVQQEERNERTTRDASNEVTYPGAVRISGPGTDSSDLERQGTIMIGSDRNIVANTPEESNENNEEGLIHAQVVDDVALVKAQPDPWWRRNQWWLAGSAAVVLGGIILAVVLTTVELSPSQEALPTMAPTTVNQGIEANTKQLILSKFAGTEDALSDQASPQSRALQWVTDRRIENEADYSTDARVLQQYSLATLYYSTNGESAWNKSDGWLNTTSECEWYGVECSQEEGGSEDSGMVVGLNLMDNGLDGTLPSDLALLSASLTVVDLSNNDLSGPIPSEIGKLTLLEDLFLSENHLADSIPTTISGMTKLLRMDR